MPERMHMAPDFLPVGTEKILAAAVGALTGALSFFFGLDTKPLIIWLAIFVGADLVTGMAAAFIVEFNPLKHESLIRQFLGRGGL